MFNRIEAYVEVGQRAAKAVNEQDEPRAKMEREYFRNMWLCESPGADRDAARNAYDTAYTAARRVPKVKAWR